MDELEEMSFGGLKAIAEQQRAWAFAQLEQRRQFEVQRNMLGDLAGMAGGLFGSQASSQGLGGLLPQRQTTQEFAEAYARGRARAEGRLPDKPKPDTILDELQQEVDQWLENTI